MKQAFRPCGTTHDYASCKVGPAIWRAVAACRYLTIDGRVPNATLVRELCEDDGLPYEPVLALVRYELPSYSNPDRLIHLNRDDRPPPALIDSELTAWAVLAKNWPIRVRLRVPGGRFIKPCQLEDWARGELDEATAF